MSPEQHRAPSGIEGTGTPGVKRAAFAATIGNMLEFYDFITYSFFAVEIGHAFFPAQSAYGSLMLSLATFGAGLSPARSAASCSGSIPTVSAGGRRCC